MRSRSERAIGKSAPSVAGARGRRHRAARAGALRRAQRRARCSSARARSWDRAAPPSASASTRCAASAPISSPSASASRRCAACRASRCGSSRSPSGRRSRGGVAAAILLHLALGTHRLRGHSPGGIIGEYGAELMISFVGRVGAALFGLVLLAVVAGALDAAVAALARRPHARARRERCASALVGPDGRRDLPGARRRGRRAGARREAGGEAARRAKRPTTPCRAGGGRGELDVDSTWTRRRRRKLPSRASTRSSTTRSCRRSRARDDDAQVVKLAPAQMAGGVGGVGAQRDHRERAHRDLDVAHGGADRRLPQMGRRSSSRWP